MFKKNLTSENTIIFEVGCGLNVPLLRHESELLKLKGYSIYRINIKDFNENIPSIYLSGKKFIEYVNI